MVWERKETDPPPSLHGVQGLDAPDQEAMGGRREGSRVEAPQGTLGQVYDLFEGRWPEVLRPILVKKWKEKSTEAVLAFLGSTRAGCISARRVAPEDADGSGRGNEGEEGGPGPPTV